ncbi:metallophosphoesterase [Ciceribacter sp. L1K22]|uniref:metallophosphoesterase n=1 Tax=Ciceribacter sp. L1K22 TaxID=2820275 RepID=UPI001ABEA358|nr:metallophosphoesterase [Ciceribacter sp. L1K22]MBO3759313.1 metallophosphoesterase [Ciceribacter sp. L1K22]
MTAQSVPQLRFGVIADPQYAPVAPNLAHDRYYANSLDKLRDALSFFEHEDLDFIVTLGDLIDHGFENFDPVLDVYAASRHDCIFLPGNHDFAVAADRLGAVHGKLSMPAPWYDREIKGVRLIVIDGNEVSLFAPPLQDPRRLEAARRLKALTDTGAPNAMVWNSGMSETQIAWLEGRLRAAEAAGERAVVLGHYPLHPFTDHSLWDAPRVAEIIANSPAAVAYLCGHYHHGNYGELNGTHFVNFKGMVDTEDRNAFAIVSLFADRIEVQGFGRELDRMLTL